MPSDPDKPASDTPAGDEHEQPAPPPRPGGRPLTAAFRLPQWFRERKPGTPPTPEEMQKLADWFAEQLRQHPLTHDSLRPPPDQPAPPDEPEQ
jgi:hypothetical protein